MALGQKTGGRQAGTPNRATSEARKAIAAFVDGNAHRLTEWLETVAAGVRKHDPETGEETAEFVVRPNPAKAFDMFQSLLEFHVPKLTRMQVSGQEDNPVLVEANWQVFEDILKNIKLQRQTEE